MPDFKNPRPRVPSLFRATLGARLREVRTATGMQQRELADLAGLRPDRLNKYESGSQPPPIFALSRLAQALSVPVDFLLPEIQVASEADRELYQQLRRVWTHPAEVRVAVGEILRRLCDFFDQTETLGGVQPIARRARHAFRR